MMQWWVDRSEREQRLLAVGAAIAASLALFQFIVVPLKSYRDEAASTFSEARTYLAEVQTLSAQLQERRGTQQDPQDGMDGASVRARVTAEATRLDLQVNRLQPGRNGELTVWLDDADPGRVMTWLVDLTDGSGLSLGAVSMRQTNPAGDIQTQVTFRAGNDG